ncbi:MAG: DUF3300 domain-containing protein [Methylacidiphilales bacterium]|nr:DUF3300 domain-containing protein [Candidatus Methylacidiphilales bacterium]
MLKRLQISFAWIALVSLLAGPIPLTAQTAPPPEAAPSAQTEEPKLTDEQLDTLLGPIALYPDPLLAQILPASTVPGDIVMAARYVAAGKDPDKIDSQPWEESVKALARYPDVLKMMDEKLDWTTDLGHAFIAQPEDVFNAVQRLRAKAREYGNLKDSPQQVVTVEKEVIKIMPADPQIIYVPQYQPQVVYVQQPPSVVAPLITFGVGFAMGYWIHNEVNWYNGNIYYHNNGWNNHYHGGGNYYGGGNNININNNNNINIGNGNGNNGSVWKPQNKPRPTPYGGGNGAGNGNRPGSGNNSKWPNNGGNQPGNNRPGNGQPGNNRPGNGNNQPGNGNNRPPGNGNGSQKPSTRPTNPQTKPGQGGGQQKPSTRPAQPANRPSTQPSQFNREGSKPRPADQGNRSGGSNRSGGGNRAAPSRGGGGGGGRAQR